MSAILGVLLLLTAASGTAVVLVRDPSRQIFVLAANGIVLTILFTALQAPDVALSELAVGAVAVPLLFLVALMAVRTGHREENSGEGDAR
ncbi:Na(+)/H(+) antiporter subunit B [Methylobacterium aerolatum]|uniref:MnhB-related membrane protein n=1 Tax=Methylobacterium aerolatum TaxID=418708 RepID=A0ABU0HUE0_9HYPH|nr:DUF4040 domain-containing protein [Methylobacterium aerolatum]MDQ0445955.1 putative MnhB-related membrane protein [Methylobacterium aerolatum]GJD35785.1 hypothetical protein FMGBMHLM_2697 [Methylobacterium aerolatum]